MPRIKRQTPDLNPLDYWFWNSLSTKVYASRREPFETVEQLKRRIKRVWNDAVNDEHLKRAILQFKKRLRAVIDAKGGQIMHKFRLTTLKVVKYSYFID